MKRLSLSLFGLFFSLNILAANRAYYHPNDLKIVEIGTVTESQELSTTTTPSGTKAAVINCTLEHRTLGEILHFPSNLAKPLNRMLENAKKERILIEIRKGISQITSLEGNIFPVEFKVYNHNEITTNITCPSCFCAKLTTITVGREIVPIYDFDDKMIKAILAAKHVAKRTNSYVAIDWEKLHTYAALGNYGRKNDQVKDIIWTTKILGFSEPVAETAEATTKEEDN